MSVAKRHRLLLGGAMSLLMVLLGQTAASAYLPADAALQREIGKVMSAPEVTSPTARVGAYVVDASTTRGIYMRQDNLPLLPASTLKVLTAGAAMRYLGPGYRWRTETWAGQGPWAGVLRSNVYLRGFGDPTLMQSDLAAIAASYRARGIRHVTGGIVADASFFDNVRYNPTWSTGYRSEYYAAEVSGLTLAPDTDYDAGTVIVTYQPAAVRGQPARLSVIPAAAAAYVRLVNRTTTSGYGTAATFAATRGAGTNAITLTGQVPLGRALARHWVTVSDPALYAATVLRVELLRAGIRVDGGVSRGGTPPRSVRLTQKWSMTLGQLLTPFLKLSNNSHAEAITKTLGTRYGRPGNWADGLDQLRQYAAGFGVSMTGASLADGSGLSRANRLTARQLIGVVGNLPKEPWFGTLLAALPVAGAQPVRWRGGTLASRMVGTPAAGNVRAKNGDLTEVSSLTGYATGADGRRYAFAMIGNFSRASTRPVEDRLGALLAGWRMTNR